MDGKGRFRLKITVKCFPPLGFPEGVNFCQLELSDGSTIFDLLELIEKKGALNHYGKNSLIILVNNKIVNNDYVLRNGEEVQIILLVGGG
ncbi:MAG: hypothetical protein PWQ70_2925 [Clostridiales bacterium]|nr:hypothetical protein [Clostridiales bacterium]